MAGGSQCRVGRGPGRRLQPPSPGLGLAPLEASVWHHCGSPTLVPPAQLLGLWSPSQRLDQSLAVQTILNRPGNVLVLQCHDLDTCPPGPLTCRFSLFALTWKDPCLGM